MGLPTPAGDPKPAGQATNEDVARGILANLGNFAPKESQLIAVEAWIQAEGTLFSPGSMFKNNPLNITVGNANASGIPSTWYTVPDPSQNGGNPVVSFKSLEGGITATAKGIQQPFASAINSLLSTPQEVTTAALSQVVSASKWGTGDFSGITKPDPTKGDGNTIGSTIGGDNSTSGNTTGTPGLGKIAQGTSCHSPEDWKDVPGNIGYFLCIVKEDAQAVLPRAAAYLVGALLIIIGVAIFIADDIQVKGVSLKQAAGKVAS